MSLEYKMNKKETVSRQRLDQRRLQAEGRCICCGITLDGNSRYLCKRHSEAKNARQRKKLGYKKRAALTKPKKQDS